MVSVAQTQFTQQQIQQLWIDNGGDPSKAGIASAIAMAESGGTSTAWNQAPPDNSVGLWQINYFGSLLAPRTAQYGSPEALALDPNAQAKAAIAISGNGQNWTDWSTFLNGAYLKYLLGGTSGATAGGTSGATAGGTSGASLGQANAGAGPLFYFQKFGFYVLAFAAILIGLFLLFESTKAGQAVTKAAGKAAVAA